MSSAKAVSDASRKGLLAALAAFALWGLLPLYWKQLAQVPPFEILCHRILWSFAFLLPVVLLTGRWGEVVAAVRDRGTLIRVTCSGLLVGFNWYLYIWAVNTGHVLETSLGYYINPLMNVALGCVFLRERPSRLQVAAICLAAFGVLWMVAGYGRFPWVALTLAGSFSLYGFMRKTVRVESIPGLFIETSILTPFVLFWLVRLHMEGSGAFSTLGTTTDLFLMGAGVATSTPLIWFAFGARILRLTTLGVLQYLAPTLAFLLGVFVFHEPMTPAHFVTFGCIWGALALYTIEGWRALHRRT